MPGRDLGVLLRVFFLLHFLYQLQFLLGLCQQPLWMTLMILFSTILAEPVLFDQVLKVTPSITEIRKPLGQASVFIIRRDSAQYSSSFSNNRSA